MALLTKDDVKSAIGYTTTPSTRDEALMTQIAASITPVIESICGPVEGRTETFTAAGGRSAILLPLAPTAVTEVTEGGAVTTDYFVDLAAGIVCAGSRSNPRAFVSGDVVIEYTVGFDPIPAHIKFAAMEQARIWWQQGQQSTHAAYGYDAEVVGSVPMGFAISNRVRELLSPVHTLPGFA